MQSVNSLHRDALALPLAAAHVRAARLSLARTHMAQFPTRMALARWTSGAERAQLADSGLPSLRSAWLARAQDDFQAWLDRGGFVQHDEPADTWLPRLPVKPHGTIA